MPAVVQAQPVEAGAPADRPPGCIQVAQVRAVAPAGDDPGVPGNPRDRRQHPGRSRRQRDGPRPGLGIAWMEYRPNPPYYMKKN